MFTRSIELASMISLPLSPLASLNKIHAGRCKVVSLHGDPDAAMLPAVHRIYLGATTHRAGSTMNSSALELTLNFTPETMVSLVCTLVVLMRHARVPWKYKRTFGRRSQPPLPVAKPQLALARLIVVRAVNVATRQ